MWRNAWHSTPAGETHRYGKVLTYNEESLMDGGQPADAQEHIVATAAKVFANEATRQVTLKRVALEARVPSDTLLEHYASAADLLRSVYRALSTGIESRFPEGFVPRHGGDLDKIQSALFDDMVMITTRAILDGVEPSSLTEDHPVIESMTRRAVESGANERTARFRTFELLLLEFGLRCFGPALAEACGLASESQQCLRHELNTLQLALHDLPAVEPERAVAGYEQLRPASDAR
jgi:AcrR family transcriptional regulator